MGFAELVAFFKALPEAVKLIRELVDAVKGLHSSAIDKELETIRKDVSDTIYKIEGAKTNEDRKKLALELVTRMSR